MKCLRKGWKFQAQSYLENELYVTSEREIYNNNFPIVKATETYVNAAPIDHLLNSLYMAIRKEVTHNVCLPF